MSQPVFDAMKSQFEATGHLSEYVFCNLQGTPVDNKNFSDRVWYPLLRHLGLTARRPYQMRHTGATLWLASGEAPEWIARQMGHTNTEMLFKVYSRYVPNLTRQDGSAMERLLASKMSQGPLIEIPRGTGGTSSYVHASEAAPQPIPKPRGNAAKHSIFKSASSDKSNVAPSKNLVVEAIAKRETKGGSTDAQPPPVLVPLTWADLAQSYMRTSSRYAPHQWLQ
jgi:integrase